MTILSKEQAASRKKVLLTALLLSTPGVVVTGIAALSSHSTTQFADFIRRSMELVAMFISWWVFTQLQRNQKLGEEDRTHLEHAAGLGVAIAMAGSGIVMLVITLSRQSAFELGGNVMMGLIIAVLGALMNGWFWWRYTVLSREQYSAVIAVQQKLYRAKALVDLCVVTALTAIVIAPFHPATPYVDLSGSIFVAGYLLWNGLRMAQSHLGDAMSIFTRMREQL